MKMQEMMTKWMGKFGLMKSSSTHQNSMWAKKDPMMTLNHELDQAIQEKDYRKFCTWLKEISHLALHNGQAKNKLIAVVTALSPQMVRDNQLSPFYHQPGFFVEALEKGMAIVSKNTFEQYCEDIHAGRVHHAFAMNQSRQEDFSQTSSWTTLDRK